MSPRPPIRVLFVCLGNICRSPLAEGLFLAHLEARGLGDRFVVDSAGTGDWHAGELPDRRMRQTAAQHGVELTSRARQVRRKDFDAFDWIIPMDAQNHADLLELGAPADRTRRLLSFDPEADRDDVPDPYYGADDGFELVYRLVDRATAALLDELDS